MLQVTEQLASAIAQSADKIVQSAEKNGEAVSAEVATRLVEDAEIDEFWSMERFMVNPWACPARNNNAVSQAIQNLRTVIVPITLPLRTLLIR